MKQNLIVRFTALIILTFAFTVCLTACSATTDIGMVDDLTEEFLDLLLSNDYDGAYAMVMENATPDKFKPYWDAMQTSVDGATAYEMEQIGWSINTTNGTTLHVGAFEITLNNGRTLFLRTTLIDGSDGIGGIYFNDTTEFNATSASYARVANIVFIVFSLLSIAFTVWMIVDCARRKIEKKALWLVLNLLCFTASLSFGQQLGIRIGVGVFFSLSRVIADPSSLSVTANLIVPLGALVYFFVRKRLTIAPPPEQIAEVIESQE